MKKLFFILMALVASFSTYAEITVNETEEVTSYLNGTIIKQIEVDLSEQTYPMHITTYIPSGDVLGVSGPCHPEVNWFQSGNILNITLFSRDFMDLDPGMTGYIEIHMTTGVYLIEFICK